MTGTKGNEGLVRLLICSDIHYACAEEQKREHYELKAISSPFSRFMVRLYRNFFWLRDPFAHNDLLKQVLQPPVEPDLVIANGDFSCDSAFIGLADPASFESASECLGQLRERFGSRLRLVMGDHELGKVCMCSDQGGLRLESLKVAQEKLGFKPVWSERIGSYILIGVTSSIAAMPVYEHEALPEERPTWQEIAQAHQKELAAILAGIEPGQKILLFCHDPTALPYLLEIPELKARLSQIERTIIGHLHSPLILWQSRILAGIPKISWIGAGVRRITWALSRARCWKPFKVMLCPSLAGIELLPRGGYYLVDLDPSGVRPPKFTFQKIRRS